MRVFNVHLDAIEFIRVRTGSPFPQALRIAQLYGFLEHLASRGAGGYFNQAAYSKKTGCHRSVIRNDLRTLEQHGWAMVSTNARGTSVRLLGLPFESDQTIQVDMACPSGWTPDDQLMDTACPAGEHGMSNNKKELTIKEIEVISTSSDLQANRQPQAAVEAPDLQPSESEEIPAEIWKLKPRKWTKAKRERVAAIWNEHKPNNFAPLAPDGIDQIRERVLARAMDGRGGYRELIKVLPKVLDELKKRRFWSDPDKAFTFDHFFGTTSNVKQHFAESVDRIKSVDQLSKPDKPPLTFDEFNWEWTLHGAVLPKSEIIAAAVKAVELGLAPPEALKEISGWPES